MRIRMSGRISACHYGRSKNKRYDQGNGYKVSVKRTVPVRNNIQNINSSNGLNKRGVYSMFDCRGKEIYLICGATDMRKGIDGLSSSAVHRKVQKPVQ